MKFDYLIVGAGPFGSVFARQMTDAGARCLVVDRRGHIAGNCYTENKENIHVHKYGAHIFIPVIKRCGIMLTGLLSSTLIGTTSK